LAEIFNISVSQGKYPSKLKISKVNTIFKADDMTDPNNYRAITAVKP